jgi:Flp pilus assembly protein TadG
MRHRERGASTVTFAFVAPVLLLILLATMEGGRIFSAWLVITNEAREAARYGAVNHGGPNGTVAGIQTYITNRLRGQLDTSASGMYKPPLVVVDGAGTPQVDVTIYYQVRVGPLVHTVLPDPFKLSARSVMRGE